MRAKIAGLKKVLEKLKESQPSTKILNNEDRDLVLKKINSVVVAIKNITRAVNETKVKQKRDEDYALEERRRTLEEILNIATQGETDRTDLSDARNALEKARSDLNTLTKSYHIMLAVKAVNAAERGDFETYKTEVKSLRKAIFEDANSSNAAMNGKLPGYMENLTAGQMVSCHHAMQFHTYGEEAIMYLTKLMHENPNIAETSTEILREHGLQGLLLSLDSKNIENLDPALQREINEAHAYNQLANLFDEEAVAEEVAEAPTFSLANLPHLSLFRGATSEDRQRTDDNTDNKISIAAGG